MAEDTGTDLWPEECSCRVQQGVRQRGLKMKLLSLCQNIEQFDTSDRRRLLVKLLIYQPRKLGHFRYECDRWWYSHKDLSATVVSFMKNRCCLSDHISSCEFRSGISEDVSSSTEGIQFSIFGKKRDGNRSLTRWGAGQTGSGLRNTRYRPPYCGPGIAMILSNCRNRIHGNGYARFLLRIRRPLIPRRGATGRPSSDTAGVRSILLRALFWKHPNGSLGQTARISSSPLCYESTSADSSHAASRSLRLGSGDSPLKFLRAAVTLSHIRTREATTPTPALVSRFTEAGETFDL